MSNAREVDGYEAFLKATAEGEPFALVCSNDHHWLPPRRICPTCGSRDLARDPVPKEGSVRSYTRIEVPPPEFDTDAPYTSAVAAFGPVTITGVIDGDESDLEVGTTVSLSVVHSESTGRQLAFRPR